MEERRVISTILAVISLCLMTAFPSSRASAGVYAVYLYNLSDFTRTVPYDSPRIFIDTERTEAYVLYKNSIKVFNDSGMEIFRFGIEAETDRIVDLAVDKDGDILTLIYTGSEYFLRRCNYRGDPREVIKLSGLPDDFSSFTPNRMVYQAGLLYLADTNSMRVALTDEQGRFLNGYDIVAILSLSEDERTSSGMAGFSVDREGNMLFTIPVFFRAYRVALNGSITGGFGQPGSRPGKFNIVGGIARDSRGNYLITDAIKCSVMVFDSEFRFLMQFGSEAGKPGELFAPRDLSVDAQDRVYVSQGRNKGVSVYRLVYD